MLKIQELFTALLRRTGTFFLSEEQDSAHDRKEMEILRQGALEFVKEINQPSADRFLAYLLTVSSVESHYPLHCLRMAALATRVLAQDSAVSPAEIEKFATAAFFADIGFRVAWLGSKGNHREIAAYHVKDMGLAWFTPEVEKLVLGHHTDSEDTSPHKVISLISRYLALTHGTGVDQSPPQLLSPAQAMSVLIHEAADHRNAIKLLLKVLSAYPLGSWVELNSGQIGIVLGANAQSPLRPRVGLYRPAAPPPAVSPDAIEEHDLLREQTLHIVREKVPGRFQQQLIDTPQCWIRGWQGGAALSGEEGRLAFDLGLVESPTGGLSEHAQVVEEFCADRKPRSSTPAAPAGEHRSQTAFDVQMDELKSLRSDWERRVLMAEEMVGKLKMGLLESYKRENDKYKMLLDKLVQVSAEQPQNIVEPARPQDPSTAFLLQDMERTLQTGRKQLHQAQEDFRVERSALQKLFAALRETLRFLHGLYTEHNAELGAAHDPLMEIMERWEAQLERLESEIVQTPPSPRSITEFELEESAARSLLNEVSRGAAQSGSTESLNALSGRWATQQGPALQKRLATAQKDLIDSLHSLSGPRHMIEQLKAEGDRLKSVLMSKIVLSYVARGIARREVGDNAAAMTYFKKAIDLKPDFWQAHAFLGLCYLAGKDARAAAEFKAAAAANPGHKDLEACLGLTAGR